MPARAVEQRGIQLLLPGIGRNRAVDQCVDRAAEVGVGAIEVTRVVGVADAVDLLDRCAEDIVVLKSGLFDDLDVRARPSCRA